MKTAAHAAWHVFSDPLEGRVLTPYLCLAHKFTVGVGNALFTAEDAAMLPWHRRSDGSLASRGEVMAEFHRFTARGDKALTCHSDDQQVCLWKGTGRVCLAHAGWTAAARVATIALTDEDVDLLVDRKLASNELRICARWPLFPTWPADAHVFAHSWAWAVGPDAAYPLMSAALKIGDFAMAARECEINPKVGTIVQRNAENHRLLMNAAHVVARGLDRETLYWPYSLSTQDAPTLPMVPNPPSSSDLGDLAGPRESRPVLELDGGASRWDATRDALYEK